VSSTSVALPVAIVVVTVALYINDVANNVQQANTANNYAVQHVEVGQTGTSSYRSSASYTPRETNTMTFDPRGASECSMGGVDIGEDVVDWSIDGEMAEDASSVNFVILPTKLDEVLGYMRDAAKKSNIKVIQAKSSEDAAKKMKKILGKKGKANNVIFGSHGGYKGAYFQVGNETFSDSKKIKSDKGLASIKKMMTPTGKVIVQACHFAGQASGIALANSLALKMEHTVFANKSWGWPGLDMFNDSWYSGAHTEYQSGIPSNSHCQEEYGGNCVDVRERAVTQEGEWVKIDFVGKTKTTTLTTIHNVYYGRGGTINYSY
jgi:hypothetical protein